MTEKLYEFGIGEHLMQNGRKARIRFLVTEPACSSWTRGGEIERAGGVFDVSAWSRHGEHSSGCPAYRLMPPKRYVWASLYEVYVGSAHNSVEAMAFNRVKSCTHCLRAELNPDGTVNWPTAAVLPIEEAKDVN